MSLLTGNEIRKRIDADGPGRIYIDPLLSDDQLGAISIDLRLGCDFLVSMLNHKPSISLQPNDEDANPEVFFQTSRRDLGDKFLLHPSQTVLATSLEYIGLPTDIYADVSSRSSYHRLGVSVSSLFQPGFRGCISLELFNHSNVPVELVVGSRIVQARFFENAENEEYLREGQRRKYIGNVRPTVSRAQKDSELPDILSLSKR